MSAISATADDITAFLGASGKLGLRYPDRVLCFECSVTLDERDLNLALEKDIDPSKHCAHCSCAI